MSLSLALSGSGTADGDNVYRSNNSFGTLPAATATGDATGSADSITLPSTYGYDYLVAKYDGQNGGTEVWYIGGIAAGTIIDIPENAFGTDNDKYGLSGYTLLDQVPAPPAPPPPTPAPLRPSLALLLRVWDT